MSAEGTFPLLDLIAAKRSWRNEDGTDTSKPDIFDLSPLCVLSFEQSEDYYKIEAETSSRPLNCPKCGADGNGFTDTTLADRA